MGLVDGGSHPMLLSPAFQKEPAATCSSHGPFPFLCPAASVRAPGHPLAAPTPGSQEPHQHFQSGRERGSTLRSPAASWGQNRIPRSLGRVLYLDALCGEGGGWVERPGAP